MLLQVWLRYASNRLQAQGEDAQAAAHFSAQIAEELLSISSLQRHLHAIELNPSEEHELNHALERFLHGEPLAYILTHQHFWTLDLEVSPDVLIPRPETERLIEIALTRLDDSPTTHVLDLGCGSGAIACALAAERPHIRVTAVDISPQALRISQSNSDRHHLNIRLLASNWFSALTGERFNLIVSNPPYLAADDPHLKHLSHEPQNALIAAEHGLADIKHLISTAAAYLKPKGALLLEHGWQQRPAILEHVATCPVWKNIHCYDDDAHRPRCILLETES